MIRFSLVSALQKKSSVVLLYLFASAYVFGVWVWSAETPTTSFNGDPHSKLSEIIYGTAHKPYVQRVLIPILTRSLYNLAPASSWDALEQSLLEIPKVQKETLRLGWEHEFLPEYLIALTLAFVCLIGFPFVVRRLWTYFYDTEQKITNSIPIVTLLALIPIFPTGPHYIYDFPTLVLFTLAFLLMLQRKWILFYALFIIGCINKETSVLITILYVLVFWKNENRRHLVLHACAQLGIFAVIKTILTVAFAANPGSTLGFHVFMNTHILLLGYSWTAFLIAAFTIALVVYDYPQKHPILLQCSFLLLPFGLLVFFFGIVTELRDIYEVVPIFTFLMLHTILFSFLKLPYRLNSVS